MLQFLLNFHEGQNSPNNHWFVFSYDWTILITCWARDLRLYYDFDQIFMRLETVWGTSDSSLLWLTLPTTSDTHWKQTTPQTLCVPSRSTRRGCLTNTNNVNGGNCVTLAEVCPLWALLLVFHYYSFATYWTDSVSSSPLLPPLFIYFFSANVTTYSHLFTRLFCFIIIHIINFMLNILLILASSSILFLIITLLIYFLLNLPHFLCLSFSPIITLITHFLLNWLRIILASAFLPYASFPFSLFPLPFHPYMAIRGKREGEGEGWGEGIQQAGRK